MTRQSHASLAVAMGAAAMVAVHQWQAEGSLTASPSFVATRAPLPRASKQPRSVRLQETRQSGAAARGAACAGLAAFGLAAALPKRAARRSVRLLATETEEKEAASEEVEAEEEPKAEAEEETEGEADVEAKAETKEPEKKTKWVCTACSHMNFATAKECDKCGAPKPSEAEQDLYNQRTKAKDNVAKALDDFIRLQAELQNYRRQHTEAMEKAGTLGKQDALRKLLPIVEDIDAALVAPEGLSEKDQAMFTSYSILFRKVNDVWAKMGAERQAVKVGDKFDPLIHLKVGEREPTGEEVPGTVLEVVKAGWKCDTAVVIPSEVTIVAFPKKEAAPAPEPSPAAAEEPTEASEEPAAEEPAAEAQ